jgi:hypothetical protein
MSLPISESIVLIAGLHMVILHRPDGGEISVAPAHVTSIHAKAPSSGQNKSVTAEARCVLWLDDGKLLAVIEPCDVVKKLLDEAAQR